MSKKIIMLVLFAGVCSQLANAAPTPKSNSSWDNESAQWQQFKAKKGFEELDAEMEKLAPQSKPAPTQAPVAAPAPVVVIVPVPMPVAAPEPPPVSVVRPQTPPAGKKPAPLPVPVAVGDNMREIIDCPDLCPQMVAIPPGKFLRGSPESEEGRNANEGPQHEVTIGYWLAVSRIQVTRGEWNRCVADEKCPKKSNDFDQQRELLPAYEITWDQAQQYIAWLNKKTKQNYRLLTEAEWEYVARAGSTTAYWWGDDFDKTKFKSTKDNGQTLGVNPPNPWGIYDLLGRQAEWVQDCYHDNFSYNPTFKATKPPLDGSVWEKNADCNFRVVRGWWADFERRNLMRPASRRKESHSADTAILWSQMGWVSRTPIGFRLGRTMLHTEVAKQ